jgi:hypothetical protein
MSATATKPRPLKVGDVVSVQALVWGKAWAQQEFPHNWRTARFTGNSAGLEPLCARL